MADTVNTGSYHLANNPQIYELQRSNNFEFVVTDLDNLRRVDTNDIIPNAQEILRFSVHAASVPHFSQQPIEIRRGNSVMKAAGLPSFSDGTLIINDYIGADGQSVLMAWQNLSYNAKTERVGLMKDYKKDCVLIEYTPDYKIVRQWELKGCWISNLSEDQFSQDADGRRAITATITYDKAFMTIEQ